MRDGGRNQKEMVLIVIERGPPPPPPLQKGKQKLGMEGDSERLKKRQRDIECKREVDSEKGKKKYSVNEREGEKKREEERGPKEEKYE